MRTNCNHSIQIEKVKQIKDWPYPFTYEDREELLVAYLPMVWKIATRIRNKFTEGCIHETSDLFQEGVIGLRDSIRLFDYKIGVKFKTYAWDSVYKRVQRMLRIGGLIRCPEKTPRGDYDELRMKALAYWTGVDEIYLERTYEVDMLEDAAKQELLSKIKAAIKTLPEREKYVWRCRYPLVGRSQSLNEIGDKMHITKERVRQLQLRAKQRIIERLKEEIPSAF